MLSLSISLDDSVLSVGSDRPVRKPSVFIGQFDNWLETVDVKKVQRCIKVCFYGSCVGVLDSIKDAAMYAEIRNNPSILLYEPNATPDSVLFVHMDSVNHFLERLSASGFETICMILAKNEDFEFPDITYDSVDDKQLSILLLDWVKMVKQWIILILVLLLVSNQMVLRHLKQTHKDLEEQLSMVKDDLGEKSKTKKKLAMLFEYRDKAIPYPISYIIDNLALYTNNQILYKSIDIKGNLINVNGVFKDPENLHELMSKLRHENYVNKIEVGDIKRLDDHSAEFIMEIWLK